MKNVNTATATPVMTVASTYWLDFSKATTTHDQTRQLGRSTANTTTQITHEYHAPYRSHADCQMRSIPAH
ncbi:hypothetical protein GCM10010533_20160 [Mycolicibacterium pallens]